MAHYDSPEKAAEFLASITLTITDTERGDFSPDHLKYHCTLSKNFMGYFRESTVVSHEISTEYQSNPKVHGLPTVTDIMSSLLSDALDVEGYTIDEYAEEFGFTKPTAAIKAYEASKRTLEWLKDDLYLSRTEITELSDVLSEHSDEVNLLVQDLQKKAAAREAYEHPKAPEGWRTIDDLCQALDLGDYGDQCDEYSNMYLSDLFGEVADANVDIYTHNLLTWIPDHYEWFEEADRQGLLEGCRGDLIKMTQVAQYVCISQDLSDHQEDICIYVALQWLAEDGVWAISDDIADNLLNAVRGGEWDRTDTGHDSGETLLLDAIETALDETFGGNGIGEMALDYVRTYDCYACVNPCAMDKEHVRMVNEKGYDAAFREDWKIFIQEQEVELPSPGLEAASKESCKSSEMCADEHESPQSSRDER